MRQICSLLTSVHVSSYRLSVHTDHCPNPRLNTRKGIISRSCNSVPIRPLIMSSQVHTPPRHRAYSAAGQPPPYSPPFFVQPPIATDAPSGRPRKHSASSSRTPRASASSSKLSRSAPATPPAYDEHTSSLRRRRTASAEFGNNLFLTPANTAPKPRLPRLGSRSVPQFTLHAEPVGPLVQPQVHALYRPPAYGSYFFDAPGSGSDDEEEEDDSLIYPTYHNKTSAPPTVTAVAVSSMSKTAGSLRARFFGANANSAKEPKSISTTPGLLGAGETETEADEPVSILFPVLFPSNPLGHNASWVAVRSPYFYSSAIPVPSAH